MTPPDQDSFLSAFALIEAVIEQRDDDAFLIMSEASIDTMSALAMVAASVLEQQEHLTGNSPIQVMGLLRQKVLNLSVN